MKILSTGDPSTLGAYKKLAVIFGDKAVQFIQDKIDSHEKGEAEEVLAGEGQMMYILASFLPGGENE